MSLRTETSHPYRAKDSTITIPSRYSFAIVSIVTLLVDRTGGQLWNIPAFCIQRFRSTPEPSDGLHSQIQSVLRNKFIEQSYRQGDGSTEQLKAPAHVSEAACSTEWIRAYVDISKWMATAASSGRIRLSTAISMISTVEMAFVLFTSA